MQNQQYISATKQKLTTKEKWVKIKIKWIKRFCKATEVIQEEWERPFSKATKVIQEEWKRQVEVNYWWKKKSS